MKTQSTQTGFSRLFALVMVAAFALALPAAQAQTITWTGGNLNWDVPDTDSFSATWTNGALTQFNAGSGVITITAGGVNPGTLRFGNESNPPNNADFTLINGGIGGTGNMIIGWDCDVIFSNQTSNVMTFSGGTTNYNGWLYFKPSAAGTYNFGTGPIVTSMRGTGNWFQFAPTVSGAVLVNDFIIPSTGSGWKASPNGGQIQGTMLLQGNLYLPDANTRIDTAITLTGNRTISTSQSSGSVLYGPVEGAGSYILTIANGGNRDAWTDYSIYVDDNGSNSVWNIGGFTKDNTGNLVMRAYRNLGSNVNLRTGLLAVGSLSSSANLINDTASLNFQGGKFMLRKEGLGGSGSETVGSINLQWGHNEILVGNNAGATQTLASASALSRSNYATALVSGNNLGGNGASGRITLPSAPTLSGGGGGAGSTTISIVPFLIGGTSVNDYASGGATYDRGSTLVTYDATTGLRALNTATEFATAITGAGSFTNVRRTTAEALGASASINSLILEGSGGAFTLGLGGNTLTVNSGAVLGRVNNATTMNLGSAPGDGFLDFNGGEGVVTVLAPNNVYGGGTLTINAVIQNGSLTKAGYGMLTLTATNTFTGPLVVNSGGRDGNNDDALYLYGQQATTDVRLFGSKTYVMANNALNTNTTPMIDAKANLVINTGVSQTLKNVQSGPNGGGTISGGGTITFIPDANDATAFTGSIAPTTMIKDGPNVMIVAGGLTPTTLNLTNGILRRTSTSTGNPSKLLLQGGIYELPFNHRDWTYNSQVAFGPGGGGWSAKGNSLITIWGSGATPQEWGVSPGFVQTGDPILFNTIYSDGVVQYDSYINLGSSGTNDREIRVTDNPGTNSDFARIQGTISGTGAGNVLWKTGDGLLELTGANTYTGGTKISDGTIRINNDARLGSVPGSASTNVTFDGGALQFSGNVTLNANRMMLINASETGTIDTQGNTDTVPGIITGPGALAKAGTGVLTLSGANDYSGGTTIAAGTLIANHATALGAASNPLTISGTGTLDVNNQSPTIGALNGVAAAVIVNNGSGSSTGTVTTAFGSGVADFAGTIRDGATRKVALTKDGGGTLVLSGANTYTGLTAVNGGALLVNGSLSSGGTVTVSSGAFLGGSGTINRPVDVVGGGILTPGTSPGTLTVDTLNLQDNSVYDWEVGPTGYDSVIVTTGLTLGSGVKTLGLTSLGVRVDPSDVFTLFTFGGSAPPESSATNWTFAVSDPHWNVQNGQVLLSGNTILLTGVEFIPEPSTLLLLALGGLLVLRGARRKR